MWSNMVSWLVKVVLDFDLYRISCDGSEHE